MPAAPCRPLPVHAWPVHDRLPAGCIAFAVTDDDSWPLACAGETVVVDTHQRIPLEGEIFVIESGRSGPRPRRRIVQAFARPLRNPDHPGVTAWWVGAYARPRTFADAQALVARGRMTLIDGPYALAAGEAYLRDHLVGRVVGVLAAPLNPEPRPAAAGTLILTASRHG